jgi:proteasome lid subunit RPN8/RPN11
MTSKNMETIQPRKKFSITGCTPPYEPAQRTIPRFKVRGAYNSNLSSGYSKSHLLYLTNKAKEQIFNHIGWGRRTERNLVEQGGILLGHVFRNENEELTYGIVEVAIAGSLAKASSASLELTHETWKEMLDSVDEILNQNPQENLQVIGWYHTHPNNLSVFMSGTDQSTQRRLFFHDWQFAIVINPHKRIWRAFYGMNADECRGFVIEGIQDSESDYFPENLSADDVERLEQDSNEEVRQNTKFSGRKTDLTRLKKYPLRLWHSVKNRFKRRKGKISGGNRARVSPDQIKRFPKAPVNEHKIDFFLWLYGLMLILILLLQTVIICLLLKK